MIERFDALNFANLDLCKKIHFIGIGGISMSTLAIIAHDRGCIVTGSDDNDQSPTSVGLIQMGIPVYSPLKAENINDPDLVVYTAAVHKENPELAEAISRGIPCISRAEYLGYLMTGYTNRIGISGTHGKSTTTAMVYRIFFHAEEKPTLACGAVLPDLGKAYSLGGKERFIYEACEYTDSFLHFNPTTAVITNIELDHVDYFDGMESLISSFKKSLKDSRVVVYSMDDPNCVTAVEGFKGNRVSVSCINENANYFASNLTSNKGFFSFDLCKNGVVLGEIKLSVPGKHNALNALCACACALENGATFDMCQKGVAEFFGIGRRFERVGNVNGAEIYIDYAHHPSEIEATLLTAKELEPSRVIGVFQSHTYTRTSQFKYEFAKALSICDKIYIAPIYPAREDISLKTVSEEDLASMIDGAVCMPDFKSIIEALSIECKAGDVVIFLGAGNINNAASELVSVASQRTAKLN